MKIGDRVKIHERDVLLKFASDFRYDITGVMLYKGGEEFTISNISNDFVDGEEISYRWHKDLLTLIEDKPNDLIEERSKTHGDYPSKAKMIQEVKDRLRNTQNWPDLKPEMKESLDLVCTKIGRILYGDFKTKDHWDDIGGYVELISRGLK